MTSRAGLLAFLMVLGVGWGLTQPLSKIAVSTGHQPFGLIFWQLVIGTALLGAISLARGRGLPLRPRAILFCTFIAFVGTIFPNGLSYAAYNHLPAGIMSIIISTVPLMALPLAVALGTDRVSGAKLAGLALGLAGVALIALPDASLPGRGSEIWLLIAPAAPMFYAVEGNVVARWGTAGLDPVQAMFGASAIGAVIALPLSLASGQWIDPVRDYAAPEFALILSSVVHALMYAGYVWLVGHAGAVFAAQCSYLVTGAGVLWSMTLLGENYAPTVWAALCVLLFGIFLVQPRAGLRPNPSLLATLGRPDSIPAEPGRPD